MPFSVLLLARNEEQNLERLMPKLVWCDDVVLVDDTSTDGTPRVAREAGARVFDRRFDTFAGQRNWALDHVSFRHEWVFHLDADEEIPGELVDEIERATRDTDRVAFWVPSKLMFFGKWLRHAAAYPVYQVRLGRNPGLRFVQTGHGQREDLAPGELGTLRHALVHRNFSKGLEEWFEKHNRYSTDEAKRAAEVLEGGWPPIGDFLRGDPVRQRRVLKDLSWRLPFRPLLRFLYLYALRLGFLDGRAGYDYCRLLAAYELMTEVKIREIQMRRRCGEP